MINIQDKAKCCGCGSCEQSCPKFAIKMVRDNEGFLYPEVNKESCINCGICDKLCPITNSKELNKEAREVTKAFGGYHKNDDTRKSSSSGGAFSLFAEKVLKENGVVYGCALDENIHAYHKGITSVSDLDELRGSKYVQSEIGNVYKEIREHLNSGRKVLFVGTPCQCAGLHSFMGLKKNPNLYMVDFICHGVPSPSVFEDYIRHEIEANGSSIKVFKFRNKDKGWNQSGLQLGTYIKYENGKEVRKYPAMKDKYMNGFLGDFYLRPSCHECHFKDDKKHYADCTIADFWGVDKIEPSLNDKKGTSLIVINTPQGEALWNEVSKDFTYKEVDFERATRRNKPFYVAPKRYNKRDKFYNDYSSKGYKYAASKYLSAFRWFVDKSFSILKSKLHLG